MSIIKHEDTELALGDDQTAFTNQQRSALQHIGVAEASEGDLQVFFHVCKRTGLDPFARQIHMIGRNTKNQRTNQWEVKYTIQTGIDGFRLIGRRAAAKTRESISLTAPQWAHEDGTWRDVWSPKWGLPIAARVTIERNGHPFPAVALFDEYKQTRKDGALTSMWAQRPAGQLAKCAEALGWRMAFPQDLSGIYADDEMHQADTATNRTDQPASGTDRLRSALKAEQVTPNPPASGTNPDPAMREETGAVSSVETQSEVPDVGSPETGEAIIAKTRRHMFALFTAKGVAEVDQLPGINHVTGGDYTSRADLTEADALLVIQMLETRPDVTPDTDA